MEITKRMTKKINDFGTVYLGRQVGDNVVMDRQPEFEDGERVCCIRQSDLIKLINNSIADGVMQEVDITEEEYEEFPPWIELNILKRGETDYEFSGLYVKRNGMEVIVRYLERGMYFQRLFEQVIRGEEDRDE